METAWTKFVQGGPILLGCSLPTTRRAEVHRPTPGPFVMHIICTAVGGLRERVEQKQMRDNRAGERLRMGFPRSTHLLRYEVMLV